MISSNALIALLRVPGVTGLNLRIAMAYLNVAIEVNLVISGQGNERLLVVVRAACL